MGEFSKSYKWNEEGKNNPLSEHPFSDIIKPSKAAGSDCVRIYMEMIAFANEIFQKGEKGEPIAGKEILDRINELIDAVMLSDKMFLELIAEDATKDDYRARHHVNVTLLSVEVGIDLGFNKSKLSELSVGAFLHDIGIAKISRLDAVARKFTPQEYDEMKKHPAYGAEILSKIKEFGEHVIYIAHEHHERINGTGYPKALKNGSIRSYAQIIGVIDIYEAMTHFRPYRCERLSSHEVLKYIIAQGADNLDPRYVESLINVIGLYPVGSWVELNTGEIGKVLEINRKIPLRPVVSIVYNARGAKLAEFRTIDISKQPIIYIKKALIEEDLKKHLPK